MSKEFKVPDYTEYNIQPDLSYDQSTLNDWDFSDTIAIDQTYEGFPGQNLLFYGMPIRKKTYQDPSPGIWMGVDTDGLAKMNVGEGSDATIGVGNHMTWDGIQLSIFGDLIDYSGAIYVISPLGLTMTAMGSTGFFVLDASTNSPLMSMIDTGLIFGNDGGTGLSTFGLYFGSGSPNGSLVAGQGSIYLRDDGTTTNDRAYINTDGNTAWTAIITAA